ncbi:hypothetical protein [Xanthobacter sp. 126]|uniref:hypothetical protein n=1 Tax=Xanthobacter sp. 126 TaxID=1131814 RepID=UPI00045E9C28|nr:hypothetical protein [Xanthobacter sp. 126]
MHPFFDDPEVTRILDHLHGLGGKYAEFMLAGVAHLGDAAGPNEWDKLLNRTQEIIRQQIEGMFQGETDPVAPHAMELMVATCNDGLFKALALATQPVEGSA